MSKVVYVPSLDRKLLSIPALTAKGMDILFDGDGCMIQSKGKVVSRVRKTGVMYVWDVQVQHEVEWTRSPRPQKRMLMRRCGMRG
jgi:hypothetical protein